MQNRVDANPMLYVGDLCCDFTFHTYTYHSRFIPKGVAETSQIFLRDAQVLPKLFSYKLYDVTGGKPIAV
jgi:hypothetical protein